MKITTRTSRRSRYMLLGGVALIAIGVLTWQAIALFTGSATATHATQLARMQIAFPVAGKDHQIGTASSGLVPGDWVERTLQVNISHNTNGDTMDDVKLTTSGSGNPTFVTTPTDGLQIWIQACDQPWTENGNSPYDYSCADPPTNVLGTASTGTDYVQAATSIGSHLDLTDGATNYLMVKLTLPVTADDTMQGQNSTLSLQFVGHQRSGHGQ